MSRGRIASSRCLGAILLPVLLTAPGCDGPADPKESLPAIIRSTVEPDGEIFRRLRVELESRAAVEVEYWSDDSEVLQLRADSSVEHEIWLPRLRADRTYRYRVRVVGEHNVRGDLESGQFSTGRLPAGLAEFDFRVSGTPSTALILLVISRADPFVGYVIMDGNGEIVWYLAVEGASGISRRADGNFVAVADRGLLEITPTRQIVTEFLSDSVAPRFHHDAIPTPDATVLAIATDTLTVGDRRITGEAIWEWTPETGEMRRRWSSFDFLDPRVDRGSFYFEHDWLHANSLWLSPRGNVILSSNYLSQVMSISPDFGSLEWRLGGPNATITVASAERFSGQHTAAEVEPGRILLFDNHREQGGYSRAVEFELVGGEAHRVWEWRPERPNFAFAVSSARRLASGNTLVTFGLARDVGGSTGPIEVYEVTPAGAVQWHLEVTGPEVMYRAEPISAIAGEIVMSTGE